MNNEIVILIAAGGRSKRMGLEISKQMLLLNSNPLIHYSISLFDSIDEVDNILLVVNDDIIDEIHSIVKKNNYKKVINIIKGGLERQDSVYNGLLFYKEYNPKIILIHDAARPFINKTLVKSVISATKKYEAAIPAINVKDTIKYTEDGVFFSHTIDRNKYRLIQTPQGFNFDLLFKSYETAYHNKIIATDDSSLVELLGINPYIVQGFEENLKITTQFDYLIAKKIIENFDFLK